MSDISIGNLTTSGSTTYIYGTSSGLETDALVENAVAANNEQADTIDIKVEENQDKIDAYDEYYSLSVALQDSLASLKSITSLAGTESSVFDQKTGTLSSNGTDASGLISVTIEEDAVVGTYDISVIQKAEEMVVQSQSVSSKSDALNMDGVFTIGLSGGDTENIAVTSDMSLEDIVNLINENTETTNVAASLLKVSENEYQMILEGTETNLDIEVTTLSGSVLSSLGLTDAADGFLSDQITQEAKGSIIAYNSTQITRDDNTYDDLIEGVSFTVKGEDSSTVVNLEVENDVSSAKEAIEGFVESYNALRDFFITNQTVNSDGSVPDEAVLFSDSMLERLSSGLSSIIAGRIYEDDAVQTIRDLGLSFDDENKLVIDDETALDDALLNNFDSVAQFFSTSVTTTNSALAVISNTSTATALDFEINITVDAEGNMSSAIVNGDGNVFEIDGNRLTGREGTQYEGLTLAYVGDTDATISVSMNAGIADLIYNTVEPYTSASDGFIQTEISSLQEVNDDLEAEAEDIRDRGEEIREKEIERYAELETELELAKNLLSQIQAILGTSDE